MQWTIAKTAAQRRTVASFCIDSHFYIELGNIVVQNFFGKKLICTV